MISWYLNTSYNYVFFLGVYKALLHDTYCLSLEETLQYYKMLYILLCYVISCYHKEFSSMKCHSQRIKGISLWRHCGAASVGGCSRVHPCIRQSERRKADARNISFQTLYDGQFTLSTYLIIPYYPVIYNVHQEVWIILKNFLYERTSHHAKLCFDRTYWLCYEANTGRSAMTYLILKRKV